MSRAFFMSISLFFALLMALGCAINLTEERWLWAGFDVVVGLVNMRNYTYWRRQRQR